jgi:hypothetical protein
MIKVPEFEYIDWEEKPEPEKPKYEEWYGGRPLTPEVEAGITEAWEKLNCD